MSSALKLAKLRARMWLHRSADFVLVGERLREPSQLHGHYVLQLTIGLNGPLHAFVDGQKLQPVWGVLVAPNVAHTVCGDVVHLFADPLLPLGRRLRGMLAERRYLALDAIITRAFLAGFERDEWIAGLPVADGAGPVTDLLAGMARAHRRQARPPLDERLENVIVTLRGQLEERTPLEQLADVAHLSPTRLTHLFTREVGMPIKQYVVWLRLLAVLEALPAGQQLGRLASASGFPDQAAFARSYRRAWGRTPSAFRQAALR